MMAPLRGLASDVGRATTPAVLDPDFVADCPYGPGALLIDDILEVDREASRVVARMPTHADLPITRDQRVHPVRHPRHVSGGLMVHMTGIMGFVHAYHVLDLRHAEGWIGYGVRIHDVSFKALAEPGEPMILEAQATRIRNLRGQLFARYTLRFEQSGRLVYLGDQTAAWTQIEAEQPRSTDS